MTRWRAQLSIASALGALYACTVVPTEKVVPCGKRSDCPDEPQPAREGASDPPARVAPLPSDDAGSSAPLPVDAGAREPLAGSPSGAAGTGGEAGRAGGAAGSAAGSAGKFSWDVATVTDTSTNLVWQRDVPASYAPACTGQYSQKSSAGDACTQEEAKKYCAGLSLAGTGWRLPDKDELLSIVDSTRSNPAIDRTAFPNTPPQLFWSSSPTADTTSGGWGVDFNYGRSSSYGGTGMLGRVRCAR